MSYRNRTEAGRRLAEALMAEEPEAATSGLVLGVPRGGVIVAAALADRLRLPLDVALARKLGAPFNPELAVGAVAEDGAVWINEALLARLGGEGAWLDEVVARETQELQRRAQRYRSGPPPDVDGLVVVVVDDGVATGATLGAVLRTLSARGPQRLVCAVPVAPPEAVRMLGDLCDAVVCPLQPVRFAAVGAWYADFSQNTDNEVIEALERAIRPGPSRDEDR